MYRAMLLSKGEAWASSASATPYDSCASCRSKTALVEPLSRALFIPILTLEISSLILWPGPDVCLLHITAAQSYARHRRPIGENVVMPTELPTRGAGRFALQAISSRNSQGIASKRICNSKLQLTPLDCHMVRRSLWCRIALHVHIGLMLQSHQELVQGFQDYIWLPQVARDPSRYPAEQAVNDSLAMLFGEILECSSTKSMGASRHLVVFF